MGIWSKMRDDWEKARADYDEGCRVLGSPPGGYWQSSLADRMTCMEAGRRSFREQRLRRALMETAVNRHFQELRRLAEAKGPQEIQFREDGVKVLVRSSYSLNAEKNATDFIIIDPDRPTEHLHLVITDDGEEVHRRWTENHD